MTPRLKRIAVLWGIGAVVLSVSLFAGGDTSIFAGWLYLVWTAPIGVIWWFYLYPYFYEYPLAWLPDIVVKQVGVMVANIVAFIFWFIVIPKLNAALERRFPKLGRRQK